MEHARKMILMPEDSVERFKQNPRDTTHKVHRVLTELANEIQPSAQTPGNPASRLDAQLLQILHSKSPKDDYERWKLYNNVLRRYLFYTGKLNETLEPRREHQESQSEYQENSQGYSRDLQQEHSGPSYQESSLEQSQKTLQLPPVASSSPTRYDPKAIIASVPKTYRSAAKGLLDHIDLIDGGKRFKWNELGQVTLDGQVIPSTNIVDLVQDTVRERKTFEATGWNTFASFLQSINTPQEFLGNKKFHSVAATLNRSFSSLNSTPEAVSSSKEDASHLSYSTPKAQTGSDRQRQYSSGRGRGRSRNSDPAKGQGVTGWFRF